MKRKLVFLLLISFVFTVQIFSQPVLDASDFSGCDSLLTTVFIEPAATYDSILEINWFLNDSMLQSTDDSLSLIINKAGAYEVKARVNDSEDLLLNPSLIVYSSPDSGFSYSDSTGEKYGYSFQAAPQAIDSLTFSYSWIIGGLEVDNAENIIHTFENAGSYNVVLRVSNDAGCITESSMLVVVSDKLECPNVFTPNMDGFNDFFEVKTDGKTLYDFRVYSRSGLEVFHSRSPSIFWDGRSLSGLEMQPGVYFYSIEPVNTADSHGLSGFVHLLR